MPLCGAVVNRFSDGEIQIEIKENVSTKDVFILQSTCDPVNDNLVELLFMVDALKRASARRITAVIPTTAMPDRTKRWPRGCPSAPSWSPIC
jgi:ribose-phosphate pyrophosphokinase